MGRWTVRRGRDRGFATTVELRIHDSGLRFCAAANRRDCCRTYIGFSPALAPIRLRLAESARVCLGAGGRDSSPEFGRSFLCGGQGDFWAVWPPCALRLCCARLVCCGAFAEVG